MWSNRSAAPSRCETFCDNGRTFAFLSSTDGLRQLPASKTGCRQCFWSLVLISAYLLFALHAALIITQYLQYDRIRVVQVSFRSLLQVQYSKFTN